MPSGLMVRIKRVYDPVEKGDGRRVLVDRLWPRGLKKDAAHVDEWLKEIAPSDALRKWFAHDPARWQEFRRKYRVELKAKQELVERLKAEARKGMLTLLFAAKDGEHNNAVVLREVLEEKG